MRKLNLLSILLIVFSGQFLLASVEKDSPVVKVLSKIKGASNDNRWAIKQGSGTLFKENGQVFILGSSHTVFHGNEIHGIQFTRHSAVIDGAEIPFTVTRLHLGKGLVRLDTEEDFSLLNRAIPFSSMVQKINTTDLPPNFKMKGVDFVEIDKELMEQKVRVLDAGISNPESKWHYLPSIPSMLELKVTGEVHFGMSGGGLFSGGKYWGMISHQFRAIYGRPEDKKDGSGTSPEFFLDSGYGERFKDAGLVTQYEAAVIPAPEIFAWLNEKNPEKAEMRKSLAGQVFNGDYSDSLLVGNLKFEINKCIKSEKARDIGGFGNGGRAGRARGDGSGARTRNRGGNGRRVGGDSNLWDSCTLTIAPLAGNAFEDFKYPGAASSWPFKSVNGNNFYSYLSGSRLFRDSNRAEITHYCINGVPKTVPSSLVTFLAMIEAGARPILNNPKAAFTQGRELPILKWKEELAAIRTQLSKIYSNIARNYQGNAGKVLVHLKFVEESLGCGDISAVNTESLEVLTRRENKHLYKSFGLRGSGVGGNDPSEVTRKLRVLLGQIKSEADLKFGAER